MTREPEGVIGKYYILLNSSCQNTTVETDGGYIGTFATCKEMMGSLVLISVFSLEISMFSLEGTVSGITSSPLCTDSDLSCHYNDIINVFI